MFARPRVAAFAALLLVAAFPAHAFATTIVVMDSDKVLNDSKVGQHIKEKLAEIAESMDAELKSEGEPVKSVFESFQERTKDLSQEEILGDESLLKEGQDLQGEIVKLSVSEQVKRRELAATKQQALVPVREALDEVLKKLVEEKNYDVLVERELVIYTSEAADITDEVITRLDAVLTTVDVARVEIPIPEAPAAE